MERDYETNRDKEQISEQEPFTMRKTIRSTTYEVSVYLSGTSGETLKDKILRLIRNEVQQ